MVSPLQIIDLLITIKEDRGALTRVFQVVQGHLVDEYLLQETLEDRSLIGMDVQVASNLGTVHRKNRTDLLSPLGGNPDSIKEHISK